jgi:hypothetical protein
MGCLIQNSVGYILGYISFELAHLSRAALRIVAGQRGWRRGDSNP